MKIRIEICLQPIPRMRMTVRSKHTPKARKNNDHMFLLADFIRDKAKGLYFEDDIGLWVCFNRQQMRRADTDNLTKMICDAIQHSGVINNDRQFLPHMAFPFYGQGIPSYDLMIYSVDSGNLRQLAKKSLNLCLEHAT